jgi:peptide deformylase
MPLEVVPYGNPILRRQSEEVKDINHEITTLIDDMTETMSLYQGIGLAAPQVGQSKMLFLINWDLIENEKSGTQAYINPRIIEAGVATSKQDEGCLSLPEVWAQVRRPDLIHVEYMDVDGKIITEELTDMPSRVFQHEYDHLLGILFIDRISTHERKNVKDILRAIMDGDITTSDELEEIAQSESVVQSD